MTLIEAKEVGLLAEALATAREALRQLSDDGESAEVVGVSFSVDHSDAGSSGLGPDVLVFPAMARSAMEFLRDTIASRLAALGVAEAPSQDAA